MSGQKILLIRLSSIGDILLTTPFIRQVHLRFPRAEIDFVVKSEFAALVKYNPHLNNVYTFNSSSKYALKKLKNSLIKRKYDYIFDLHNNFRSIYLRCGLRSKYRGVIKKDKIRQLLLLHFKLNFYKNSKPIPRKFLETGFQLGIKDDNKGLEIFWSQEDYQNAELIFKALPFNANEKFICIAPGAGFFTKRWPIEYFTQLIERIHAQLKVKIVILGGVDDKEVTSDLTKNTAAYDLSGRLSLLGSAVILSKSSAIVCNDTGLMHLAAAVNTPVVTIFGSSVKEWGFEPFRIPHILIEETGLSCRPCSHIGRMACPKMHFKCMMNIHPDRVFKALQSLLKIGQNLND